MQSPPSSPDPNAPPPGVQRIEAGLNWEGILALAAVIGGAMLLLDLMVGAGWTGVFAIVGMQPVLLALVRKLLGERSVRIRRRLRALIGVDVLVALTLFGMVIARGFILTQQFAADDAGDYTNAARLYTLVFALVAALSAVSAAMPERLARLLLRMIQRPALLLAGSFAALIAVMTLLLALPPAVERVEDISFVNALFTVTSAVCVTGLVVNDPGSTYTAFGEAVILLSIQLGGMGIMTIAALSLAFARNTALATQLRYAKMMDVRTLADLRTTVGSIVIGTIVLEAIGALILWGLFSGDPAIGTASAGWMALFHAVSAFCNAGFSLFDGGMANFATSASVQIVIMTLVVLGGLGFPVMRELLARAIDGVVRVFDRKAPRPVALSLASRVVLVTTGGLIVLGALLFLVIEYGKGFGDLPGAGQRVLASIFLSVNTRTSGFNTVDIGALAPTTLLLVCVWMFIGGSPGSTAGGIKTTTFATILATLRAELSGNEPAMGRRAIATDVVRRAIAVTALSAMIVLTGLLALTLTESHDFLPLLFETVSAFATVGLSTGITGDLSVAGKLIVSVIMFVGRVGPLTIALAVASSATTLRYRLARESLPIG